MIQHLLVVIVLLIPFAASQNIAVYAPQSITTCSGAAGVCSTFSASTDTQDQWCNAAGAINAPCSSKPCNQLQCAQFVFSKQGPAIFTSQWLVGTNMQLQTGQGPRFRNDTITGAQISFTVDYTKTSQNGLSVQAVTMVDPATQKLVATTTSEGSLGNLQLNDQKARTLCYPSSLLNSPSCTSAGYMWTNGAGFSMSTVNYTDPNFGIAFRFGMSNDDQPSILVSNFRLLVYWQSGLGPTTGTTLPPTNTTVPLTTAGSSFSALGAIIGGAVAGGLLLIAGVVVLIYFVRRRQLQKPAIKLDDPIPYSAM